MATANTTATDPLASRAEPAHVAREQMEAAVVALRRAREAGRWSCSAGGDRESAGQRISFHDDAEVLEGAGFAVETVRAPQSPFDDAETLLRATKPG